MTTSVPSVSPESVPPLGLIAPEVAEPGPAEYRLVPASCILCDHDDAEPVAVGKDFSDPGGSEAFLAVSCRTCGLIYLNPAVAPPDRDFDPDNAPDRDVRLFSGTDGWITGRALAREITRFAKRLPSQGHLVYLGDAGAERPDIVRRSLGANWLVETRPVLPHGEVEWSNLADASYDAVLMIGVLEQVNDPLAALKVVSRLLRPGGLVLIVTPYTQSSASNVFRGRHWSGYSFPRHPNLFDGKSLGRAAGLAGLSLITVRTAPAPRAWLESARNLMADWRSPAWMVTALGQPSFAVRAAATAIEWSQQVQSKGGLLVAAFQRSGR
jgi:SAM-dependent methyltransferase